MDMGYRIISRILRAWIVEKGEKARCWLALYCI
jgi:hypothetical protein